MSIDKTLRFTQSRGFFIIKSLYQNRELHPKYGIYKPSGLLQDTHFVCTNCKSC